MRHVSRRFTVLAAATLVVGALGIGCLTAVHAARQSSAEPATPAAITPVGFGAEVYLLPSWHHAGRLIIVVDQSAEQVCVQFDWQDTDTYPVAQFNESGQPLYEIGLHDSSGAPLIYQCVNVDQYEAQALAGYLGSSTVLITTAEHPDGRAFGTVIEGARPSPNAVETEVRDTPVRVYDSRNEGTGKLAASETRTIDLPLPDGARAAIVTVTVDQTEGSGYLTLYAADTTLPPTSNINWTTTGQTVATSATVNVDDEGRINITNGPNATHVIVDLTGHLNGVP